MISRVIYQGEIWYVVAIEIYRMAIADGQEIDFIYYAISKEEKAVFRPRERLVYAYADSCIAIPSGMDYRASEWHLGGNYAQD